MRVDLDNVRLLVERALLDIDRLDGMDTAPDVGKTAKRGDSAAADINRRLSFLTHTLRRAASETDATYFKLRGFADPLEAE